MTEDTLFKVLPLLVPVITVVVGAAVAAFQDRQHRRSQAGRRKLTLEDARAQVAFVSEWLQATRALGQSPAEQEAAHRADAWLTEASQRVAANPAPQPRTDLPGAWRRFLLAYPLRSTAARAARAAFYLVLGWTPIVLGAGASNLVMSLRGFAGYNLAIAAAAVVIAISFRALAVAIERHQARHEEKGAPARGLFRTALLFYRLEAPAARWGRLATYLILVTFLVYVIRYLVLLARYPVPVSRYLPLTIGTALALLAAVVGVRSWTLHLERQRGHSAVASDVDASGNAQEVTP